MTSVVGLKNNAIISHFASKTYRIGYRIVLVGHYFNAVRYFFWVAETDICLEIVDEKEEV